LKAFDQPVDRVHLTDDGPPEDERQGQSRSPGRIRRIESGQVPEDSPPVKTALGLVLPGIAVMSELFRDQAIGVPILTDTIVL